MHRSVHWTLLSRYLRTRRRAVALLAGLLFGSIGLQLVNPLLLRAFIDGALAGSTLGRLIGIAVVFIVVALLAQGVSVAATYVGEQVGWGATNDLRADLALHCLRLDMPFHHTHTPGEMIERIDGDITALAGFFSQLVLRVIGGLLLLAGVLIILFREDARVGVALTAFSAVALALLHRWRSAAVPHMTEGRQATGELFGFLEERIAGLDDIRANGAGAYTMARFAAGTRGWFRHARRAMVMADGVWVMTRALFGIGRVLALALGVYLYRADAITLGTVFLFYQYTDLLQRPLEQISQQLREFQQAGAGISRVRDLLALSTTIPEGLGPALPDGPLAVAFDRVSFAYHPDEPVLEDISFRLAPGHVLGLLGRTGGGKTTIARLLSRLYLPVSGSIRLGGADIRDVPAASLRARVGVVTQEVQIFNATVRDNLTFFDPVIPDDRILEALEGLGLGGWLRSLPQGLDTELPPGGGLSAGEAQLLAFARVFLRDPGLVILDEASSRLDPATERLIERAIDRLLDGRTAIIIAHRLGTVQRADDILVIEGGRIAEHGRRAELAADHDSRFSALLRAATAFTPLDAVLASGGKA